MEKPEFLHETLQRLIFDFLIEHKDEEFMELKTDATHANSVSGTDEGRPEP